MYHKIQLSYYSTLIWHQACDWALVLVRDQFHGLLQTMVQFNINHWLARDDHKIITHKAKQKRQSINNNKGDVNCSIIPTYCFRTILTICYCQRHKDTAKVLFDNNCNNKGILNYSFALRRRNKNHCCSHTLPAVLRHLQHLANLRGL